MDIKKFPNPSLNLPKDLRDSKDDSTITSFKCIEQYIGLVGIYIYTDIDLEYPASDPNHIHAWIQKIISAYLLRSLYIRNAFVETMNVRNFVGMFLPLKAWLETVGVLASILDLLEKNLPQDQLYKELEPYALGNRGKGGLRVGSVEAKNVLTMIEKADKYMEKMAKEQKNSSYVPAGNFFTDFYDIASNPSHPSFEAQEMVGSADDWIWKADSPEETKNKILTNLPNYGGLLISPLCIRNICQKIFDIEKDSFAKLNSRKYFD